MARPRKQLKDYGLQDDWQDVVLRMSAEGCSAIEIRAALVWNAKEKSFNHNAWDRLQEIDDEFLTAIKKAQVLCQAWWEKQGRKGLRHSKQTIFETALWFINMKNRFGWRDKHDVGFDLENADQHFKEIADAIGKSDTNSK